MFRRFGIWRCTMTGQPTGSSADVKDPPTRNVYKFDVLPPSDLRKLKFSSFFLMPSFFFFLSIERCSGSRQCRLCEFYVLIT